MRQERDAEMEIQMWHVNDIFILGVLHQQPANASQAIEYSSLPTNKEAKITGSLDLF
jgi:hypothetical protein